MKKILLVITMLASLSAQADQWYQDASGKLHFLSTQDIANGGVKLLPVGIVQITSTQAAAVALMPNPAGFESSVKIALGGVLGTNAMMVAYPAFFPSIQSSMWADTSALMIDAKAKSVISTAQYAAIKSAASSYNIPIVLP